MTSISISMLNTQILSLSPPWWPLNWSVEGYFDCDYVQRPTQSLPRTSSLSRPVGPSTFPCTGSSKAPLKVYISFETLIHCSQSFGELLIKLSWLDQILFACNKMWFWNLPQPSFGAWFMWLIVIDLSALQLQDQHVWLWRWFKLDFSPSEREKEDCT